MSDKKHKNNMKTRRDSKPANTSGANAAVAERPVAADQSWLSEDDLHYFNEGTHYRLYEKLGAHPTTQKGTRGTHFAVWAPNARRVSVIGNFNNWTPGEHPLHPRGKSGIWEGFLPGIDTGTVYKYHIESQHHGYQVDKADPFGFMHETPPATASIVRPLDYQWTDDQWMAERAGRQAIDRPISIYEMHLGSWMRVLEEDNRSLTYRELAPRLAEHLTETGFTHVEFMPVMEHPFGGSWGYQVTGYFAPTSRFGTPEDFMYLVDYLHSHGIGVILDWVPSHFPTDEHGLGYFDGTHLFEHADPRQGFHPDWQSYIFNFGRNEIVSFLISNAMFWLDQFHIDGLRVDAVASMLYLDYSREDGEWIANKYGGRENIEAIELMRQLNTALYGEFPGIQTIAEESTAWPMVSRPGYVGGLGFGYKWDMGWMHDTLHYFQKEPIHRKFHHNELTFRAIYQFNENYVLPLSHDEVVHGKGSLIGKMPGDEWQKFANLRLLLANQWTQPGKKLLFMGCEIAQWSEWGHDHAIEWHLLEYPSHKGIQRLVCELNRVYRDEPALHRGDCQPEGFRWVDANDSEHSVISFLRRSEPTDEQILVVYNATPVVHYNYKIGVPTGGQWQEILNTDAEEFGGSGQGNLGVVEAAPVATHGQPYTLNLTLPPLGAVLMKAPPSASSRKA